MLVFQMTKDNIPKASSPDEHINQIFIIGEKMKHLLYIPLLLLMLISCNDMQMDKKQQTQRSEEAMN